MEINKAIRKRRKDTLNHLNRIQGQIETLKEYIGKDASCIDIAMLVTSIAKSFDSLRGKTLEGSIINHVLNVGNKLSAQQRKQIQQIINLYKK